MSLVLNKTQILKRLKKIPRKEDGRIYITHLKPLVKDIGKDQPIADFLWAQSDAAAKELAVRVAEPKTVSKTKLQTWVKELDEWGLTDAFSGHLVKLSAYPVELANDWVGREAEYQKRAGFATIAQLAWSKNDVDDRVFVEFLKQIKHHAGDDRHHVKKAVNWALRDIGKRNKALEKPAQDLAIELQESLNKTEKWVGSHRIKEIFI